jgi:hypothetical protein
MPVAEYTRMLHMGATSGVIPLYDATGTPTGTGERIPVATRLEILRYLTDKVLPAPKPQTIGEEPPPLEVIAERSSILKHLTIDQLRSIRDRARAAKPDEAANG